MLVMAAKGRRRVEVDLGFDPVFIKMGWGGLGLGWVGCGVDGFGLFLVLDLNR